ncbi:transposable element Tcb1 transposase [Trichonephila clavipes]|nr:transposable element Tcb1 transposase [Trichonephila clavipes]
MKGEWSARQVACQLGHNDCVVRRCCDYWIQEMSVTRRPDSEHPRQTSRREESRFNLSCGVNRVRVWKPCGERLNPVFALQRHTTPTVGVIVWGAIVYNRQPTLVLIRDTMAAQRYVHAILQPHVLPLMQRLAGAIYQQDNARPHTARVSQYCLLTVTILPLSAQFPDLSPIEHI